MGDRLADSTIPESISLQNPESAKFSVNPGDHKSTESVCMDVYEVYGYATSQPLPAVPFNKNTHRKISRLSKISTLKKNNTTNNRHSRTRRQRTTCRK